jgi:hypothetical protein
MRDGKAPSNSKLISDGYNQILTRLEAIKLKQADTATAMGLLMYSLHYAVAEFCKQNYLWPMSKDATKKVTTA